MDPWTGHSKTLCNIGMMLKLFLSTQGNTDVSVILCIQDIISLYIYTSFIYKQTIYIYIHIHIWLMTKNILLIERLEGNI